MKELEEMAAGRRNMSNIRGRKRDRLCLSQGVETTACVGMHRGTNEEIVELE